jgi:hypothetical protein
MVTAVLAASSSSGPRATNSFADTAGADRVNTERTRRGVSTDENEEEATGMSEARSNRHRGKKTPTLAIPLRQRKEREAPKVSELDPPKRIWAM